jgi:hypothetical protein
MKSNIDVVELLASNTKEMEQALGIKVRNGQALQAVKKTLAWVLK